jgi:hypothetical protein
MASTFRLGLKEKLLKIAVDHAPKVSILLFLASIGFLLSWPYQAKNAYFSENALSVGSAEERFYMSKSDQSFESLGLEVFKTNITLQAKWRAPRGNGKESILLGATHTPENEQLLTSIMKHIVNAKWLHHDIIIFLYKENAEFDPSFSSHGIIRQAIFLDFDSFDFAKILIGTEGYNGQLPNLDFLNTAVWYLTKNGFPVDFSKRDFSVGPKYDTLIHHFWNLLKSEPTGRHADFRKYGTHALTLRGLGVSDSKQNMENIGSALIGTIRCLNNLIEQLHHSYFQYFMINSHQFMGFDEFLPNLLMFMGSVLFLIQFDALKITMDMIPIVLVVVASLLISQTRIYILYILLVIGAVLIPVDSSVFQNDNTVFVLLSLCSVIVSHPALFISMTIYTYLLLQIRKLNHILGLPLMVVISPFPLLYFAKFQFYQYLVFLLIPGWIFTLKAFIVFKTTS